MIGEDELLKNIHSNNISLTNNFTNPNALNKTQNANKFISKRINCSNTKY